MSTSTVKKTRARIACDYCKRRKVKCDGEFVRPCSQCKKKGINCSWETPTNKRGRKKRPRSGEPEANESPPNDFWKQKYIQLASQRNSHPILQVRTYAPSGLASMAGSCISSYRIALSGLFPFFIFESNVITAAEIWANLHSEQPAIAGWDQLLKHFEHALVFAEGARLLSGCTDRLDKFLTDTISGPLKSFTTIPRAALPKWVNVLLVYCFYRYSRGEWDVGNEVLLRIYGLLENDNKNFSVGFLHRACATRLLNQDIDIAAVMDSIKKLDDKDPANATMTANLLVVRLLHFGPQKGWTGLQTQDLKDSDFTLALHALTTAEIRIRESQINNDWGSRLHAMVYALRSGIYCTKGCTTEALTWAGKFSEAILGIFFPGDCLMSHCHLAIEVAAKCNEMELLHQLVSVYNSHTIPEKSMTGEFRLFPNPEVHPDEGDSEEGLDTDDYDSDSLNSESDDALKLNITSIDDTNNSVKTQSGSAGTGDPTSSSPTVSPRPSPRALIRASPRRTSADGIDPNDSSESFGSDSGKILRKMRQKSKNIKFTLPQTTVTLSDKDALSASGTPGSPPQVNSPSSDVRELTRSLTALDVHRSFDDRSEPIRNKPKSNTRSWNDNNTRRNPEGTSLVSSLPNPKRSRQLTPPAQSSSSPTLPQPPLPLSSQNDLIRTSHSSPALSGIARTIRSSSDTTNSSVSSIKINGNNSTRNNNKYVIRDEPVKRQGETTIAVGIHGSDVMLMNDGDNGVPSIAGTHGISPPHSPAQSPRTLPRINRAKRVSSTFIQSFPAPSLSQSSPAQSSSQSQQLQSSLQSSTHLPSLSQGFPPFSAPGSTPSHTPTNTTTVPTSTTTTPSQQNFLQPSFNQLPPINSSYNMSQQNFLHVKNNDFYPTEGYYSNNSNRNMHNLQPNLRNNNSNNNGNNGNNNNNIYQYNNNNINIQNMQQYGGVRNQQSQQQLHYHQQKLMQQGFDDDEFISRDQFESEFMMNYPNSGVGGGVFISKFNSDPDIGVIQNMYQEHQEHHQYDSGFDSGVVHAPYNDSEVFYEFNTSNNHMHTQPQQQQIKEFEQ